MKDEQVLIGANLWLGLREEIFEKSTFTLIFDITRGELGDKCEQKEQHIPSRRQRGSMVFLRT